MSFYLTNYVANMICVKLELQTMLLMLSIYFYQLHIFVTTRLLIKEFSSYKLKHDSSRQEVFNGKNQSTLTSYTTCSCWTAINFNTKFSHPRAFAHILRISFHRIMMFSSSNRIVLLMMINSTQAYYELLILYDCWSSWVPQIKLAKCPAGC